MKDRSRAKGSLAPCPCSPQARLGRTSTDAVEVGAGVQAGMERAREVADGERASTQSPDSASADADAHEAGDAAQQPDDSSGSGSSDDRAQDGDSPQQVPELYAPGRLLYIRQESGADEWHVHTASETCDGCHC